MKMFFFLFLAAVLLTGCTKSNPSGPTQYKGFSASTDSSTYSAQSPVTVTITNHGSDTGLFSACNGVWEWTLQENTDSGWTNVNGLGCIALHFHTMYALQGDSSYSATLEPYWLYPSGSAAGTYRVAYKFSVSPDSSLSYTLLSNTFTVR